MVRNRLLILTQIFYPQTGGAATYYYLLCKELLTKKRDVEIYVLTENYFYKKDLAKRNWIYNSNRLVVIRKFPVIFSEKNKFRKYIQYLWQNFNYLLLLKMIKLYKINSVLIHANLHMFPNLLYFVLRLIKNKYPHIRLIADVRDWHIAFKRLYQLEVYDKIIACSDNIKSYLCEHEPLINKIVKIPVMQEKLFVSLKLKEKVFKRFKLKKPFIFYGGVIKDVKGIYNLLEAFKYISEKKKDLWLVLAGINKENNSKFWNYLFQNPKIKYIGPIPREEILALLAFSELNINLSPIEAMPRISLEALALGTKVALPPNVPEFEKFCPEWIIKEKDPKLIAQNILYLLERKDKPNYPIELHYPDKVIPMYLEILFQDNMDFIDG